MQPELKVVKMNQVAKSESNHVAEPWANVSQYIPEGFRLNANGLYQVNDKGDQHLVAGPVWVSGATRSVDGSAEWGLIVTFLDQDTQLRELAISMVRIHEARAPLVGELAGMGLRIIPGKQNQLMAYLGLFDLPANFRRRSVGKLGWISCSETESPQFMTPTEVIGLAEDDGRILYQPAQHSPTTRTMKQKGTLEQWKLNVATPCIDEPFLYFAIASAFVGPLLGYANQDCGGVHFYGTSSRGKTTTLQVASSVWGPGSDPAHSSDSYLTRWNSTQNALEAIAAAHNDSCLVLDEIGTCDARDIGRTIYDLFGGQGRKRLNQNADLKASRTWRTWVLSSGEISSRQKIEEGGQSAKLGHSIRLLDIPIGNSITTEGKGRDYVDNLKRQSERFYGAASREFIRRLLLKFSNFSEIRTYVRSQLDDVTKRYLAGKNLDSAQERAIKRLLLVHVAGVMATELKVLPGDLLDVQNAVTLIIKLWLGDSANLTESTRVLRQVRDFIQSEGARFRDSKQADHSPRDLVGYRYSDSGVMNQNTQFMFTEKGFAEAIAGFDKQNVINILKGAGYLHHDKSRNTKRQTIAGFDERMPLFTVKQALLTDDI